MTLLLPAGFDIRKSAHLVRVALNTTTRYRSGHSVDDRQWISLHVDGAVSIGGQYPGMRRVFREDGSTYLMGGGVVNSFHRGMDYGTPGRPIPDDGPLTDEDEEWIYRWICAATAHWSDSPESACHDHQWIAGKSRRE